MIVTVVGVGVIGGSVGLAARRRLGATVRGVDPRAATALAAGAVDEAHDDLEAALAGAQVAVVAVPVAALEQTVVDVLRAAPPECVVTDVGSIKQAVVEAAAGDPRFVGGHPLAGSELAGVEHASADMFDGATWYLTPTPATSGLLLERLHRMLAGLGAQPAALDAATHDRVMAAVSHLPHVLANVLVSQAAGALGGERLPATGPSFRDATRVAGANPELWAAIYTANAEAIAAELDAAIERLGSVRDALRSGEDLSGWQRAAADDRRALLEVGLAGGPLCELRAAVPNRTGVIARIALRMGEEGISIADMVLSPSLDNTRGEIALWVPERQAARGAELLAELGFGEGRSPA